MVSVRYLVQELDLAIEFYQSALGFKVRQQYGSAMAILEKGELNLWLAGTASSAAQPIGGAVPHPGGWNRIVIEVIDLPGVTETLKIRGTIFRHEMIRGPGGRQILCEDPSGNPIELFEPC